MKKGNKDIRICQVFGIINRIMWISIYICVYVWCVLTAWQASDVHGWQVFGLKDYHIKPVSNRLVGQRDQQLPMTFTLRRKRTEIVLEAEYHEPLGQSFYISTVITYRMAQHHVPIYSSDRLLRMPINICVLFLVFNLKYMYSTIKRLVHPKMKISLCFTHPRGILGVYDFLLSDKPNQSYIKKLSWLFQALSLQWVGVSVQQSKRRQINAHIHNKISLTQAPGGE